LGSIVTVVTDFCRNVVDDSATCYAFQLAAYELTENLVKYSSGDQTVLRVSVDSTPRGPDLVLVTENEANAERLADADARLTAVERAEDPVAHFDALVQEAIESPEHSRLGLGRLRAEGDLLVSHRVSDGRIAIEVRRPVRKLDSRGPES